MRVGLAKREYEAGKAPGVGQIYFGVRLANASTSPIKVLWPVKPRFGEPVLPLGGDESVKVELIYASAAGEKTTTFTPPNRPIVYVIEPGQEK